ncbi:MAG: molybdopterin-dependent oxidoreductase [Anaerolineae bacterium]|nr:molybdopterin-dependent oxidoreductase [Anaerolineae bacterium]
MNDTLIGARAPKLDAPAKVSGRAVYGHDLVRPRMLYGKIVRSSFASARIVSIDTSRAEKLPGVRAIITGADAPARSFGYGDDNQILKAERVRRVGDEIAAVAAADPFVAHEAAQLVRVEYEPLPAVFDTDDALCLNAPLLHPQHGSNLFRHQQYQHGDPDAAFAEADVVVQDEFELGYVANMPMEPCFCLAEYDAGGDLNLYSTTQVPYLLQRDLAEALDIPAGRVRIIQTVIGGSFGRGLDMYPFEPIAALLAHKTGRPVRIAFDRREEFLAAPVRQPMRVKMRSAAKRDGTLWARDAHAVLNIGAYASWGAQTTLVMAQTVGSLYRVPHARFIADLVYTNSPVTGAMRGFGNPQSTFFVETQMDRLAEALGMDPLEFRLRNANRPNEITLQGLEITSCGMSECLQAVGAMTDRAADDASPPPSVSLRRGVGFAATMNVGGGARIYRSDGCGATVKVDDFGRVTLITGASEIGQGSDIVLAQIVAETLGVPLETVRVINGDTALGLWDVGVHASRTTFIAGNAARLAALDARAQILETAAEQLRVATGALDIRGGTIFVTDDPAQRVALDKVVRARHFRQQGTAVIGRGWYDPPSQMADANMRGNLSAAYSFGAHAVEVEVDVETGHVRVVHIDAAHDVGRAINPMLIEGQVEGGIHMGIGYALTEQLLVENGRVLNDSLREYGVPTALDMPSIDIQLVETNDPQGPFGAKGVGELGVTPVAAAIANAIYTAVGVRITSLPITPEKVLCAIQAK